MPFKVIKESIIKDSENRAREIRESAQNAKTLVLNLISSPGAGKTSLLEKIGPMLKKESIRFAVLTGDCFTSHDAQRIDAAGIKVVQINTGNSCHIDAQLVQKAMNEINLNDLDLVIIENVGNLVCPAEFDVGEDSKIAVLSIPEGDDKPLKYPLLFSESSLVVLNKIDLIAFTNFNIKQCKKNIVSVNKNAHIIEISCTKNQGIGEFVEWLKNTIGKKKES